MEADEVLRRQLVQDRAQEHVGQENIHKRLKLNFGNEYGLKIESDGSTYTEILMVIHQITGLIKD